MPEDVSGFYGSDWAIYFQIAPLYVLLMLYSDGVLSQFSLTAYKAYTYQVC